MNGDVLRDKGDWQPGNYGGVACGAIRSPTARTLTAIRDASTSSPWAACGTVFKSVHGNFCDYGQDFHSDHEGGAPFGLVDRSVRFISENTGLKVFAALLSRSGSEVIGDY